MNSNHNTTKSLTNRKINVQEAVLTAQAFESNIRLNTKKHKYQERREDLEKENCDPFDLFGSQQDDISPSKDQSEPMMSKPKEEPQHRPASPLKKRKISYESDGDQEEILKSFECDFAANISAVEEDDGFPWMDAEKTGEDQGEQDDEFKFGDCTASVIDQFDNISGSFPQDDDFSIHTVKEPICEPELFLDLESADGEPFDIVPVRDNGDPIPFIELLAYNLEDYLGSLSEHCD